MSEVMREVIEEEEIEKDQYLVFGIGPQEFGIQAMRVQEISRVIETTPVPNAPPYVEGILNLRGRLATVINFRKKFGYEEKANDEDTRIVIVELHGFPVGIIVDAVAEVIKVADDTVQALPETSTTLIARDYVTGVGIVGERLIILLDVDKVLNVAELAETEQIKQTIDKEKQKQGEPTAIPPREEKSRKHHSKREG